MNANKQPDAEKFDAAELGELMREMRENLGHKLDDVARDLRIRLVYLQAIEAGRLSDLPGNVYVSGFLRSYSDFLGLEGEEIVRRFKMAGVEINSQPQLHLPSPVEEGRLPTPTVLLVATVIAAAAYGGWYYLSGSGKGSVETVASLPKELSGLVEKAKNQRSPTKVSNGSAATPTASHVVAPTAPATGATSENTGPAVRPTAPVSIIESTARPARVEASASASIPEQASRTVRDSSSTETASRSSAGRQSSSDPSAGGVGIIVRATADSYVAVRTSDNHPLFSRLMRRGDSYEVPSGAALILETGNAGGLQITVDGKRVPSLGLTGEIRRNIPLDAEKLLSGTYQ